MSVANNTAKVRKIVVKRHYLESVARRAKGTEVLSQSQSPFGLGSQFTASTLVFKCENLSKSAQEFIQSYDSYCIDKVEIFATVTNVSTVATGGVATPNLYPVVHYCYEDFDADEVTATSWIRTSDRSNLSRVVLRPNNPSILVATLRVRPTYEATTTTNGPVNVVPKPGTHIDALNLTQPHAGLRCFSACPLADGGTPSYAYEITYECRYHLNLKSPL